MFDIFFILFVWEALDSWISRFASVVFLDDGAFVDDNIVEHFIHFELSC